MRSKSVILYKARSPFGLKNVYPQSLKYPIFIGAVVFINSECVVGLGLGPGRSVASFNRKFLKFIISFFALLIKLPIIEQWEETKRPKKRKTTT